jgi:hypothetical protein
MGWTSFNLYNNEKTVDVIKRELEQTKIPGVRAGWGFEYITVRGSTVYGVMWSEPTDTSERKYFGIVVTTSRKAKQDHTEFYYKDMDECMGPHYYDAPKKMLDLLDQLAPNPQGMFALKWREACRARLASKTSGRKPVAGMRIHYGKMDYTLIEPAGPRRGWHVKTDKGIYYRMTAAQIVKAMQQQEPEPTFTKEVTPQEFFKAHIQHIHVGAQA